MRPSFPIRPPPSAFLHLPAGEAPGAGRRGRHHALRRPLPGVQLLPHPGGGDARGAPIPLGNRAAGGGNRHPAGPGFSRRAVGRLLAAEGFLVAAAGSALGVAAGVGYAALLLAGLQTWWLAAIVTPFLHLYVTPWSLAIGYAGGLLAAMLTILATVRRLAALAPRRLLAGQTGQESLRPLPGGVSLAPARYRSSCWPPRRSPPPWSWRWRRSARTCGPGRSSSPAGWRWGPAALVGVRLRSGATGRPWPPAAATCSAWRWPRRAESRPQHAHHGPGGRRLLLDRGRRRLPRRPVAARPRAP